MIPAPIIDLFIDKVLPAFVTFYLVSLGHSISEKSGILNLAIDGVFFASTGAALLGAAIHGNPLYGFIYAYAIGAILGLFMSTVLTFFPVSHGAVGLSLQFLGYGVGIMLGYYIRIRVGVVYAIAFTREEIIELFTIGLVIGIAMYYLIEKTKLGAAIKAVGENPHAAAVLGVRVLVTRVIAGLIGFGLIGIGSSVFILSWIRTWDAKLYTLGYGWLAFAAALAAGRHPLMLIPIALLFGGLTSTQTDIQVWAKIPADVAKLIPFLAALTLMLTYSMTRLRRVFASPSSLGKPFFSEEKSL
ncbi:MAG: ribose ABC transporter permease [Desulfurococcaceae archaeon]